VSSRLSSEALGSAAEAVVVALAQSGDRAGFEELIRRRQVSTRQLLRRLSRDSSLADDLAQNMFLIAWRRLRSLREPAAFGAWLRQITVNEWLMHVRSRDPQLQQSECSEPLSADARRDGDGSVRDHHPT
jgi:RNA polymerase sigma-70 factor, ECF subfamily